MMPDRMGIMGNTQGVNDSSRPKPRKPKRERKRRKPKRGKPKRGRPNSLRKRFRKMKNLKSRMSASAASLTQEEYDQRKRFADEVKLLTKNEMEEIYKLLKTKQAEYSENSNGVFFDVSKLPAEIFSELQNFMVFCTKNRDEFSRYEEAQKKAQDALFYGRD
jgi:predicted nuclease with TOPRIM domain